MKTKCIKGIITMGFTAMMLLFSSCLKDARFFDPGSVQANLAELPLSGLKFFGSDAVTGQGIDTVTFAVGVTAADPPTTATTVVLAVDNTFITSYNAANPAVTYLPIPAAAFKLVSTSVTIPAGQNTALTSVIIDRTQLDPTLSYMLPVKIVSAGGLPISANFSVHYFHVIGNDFAGTYLYDYTRIPAAGNFVGHAGVLSPDSPTQLEGISSYFSAKERYIITFKKTGSGSSALYSNFTVAINPADYQSVFIANGLSIVTGPELVNYVPGTSYTYDQVVHGIFKFHYVTASGRDVTDYYYKP